MLPTPVMTCHDMWCVFWWFLMPFEAGTSSPSPSVSGQFLCYVVPKCAKFDEFGNVGTVRAISFVTYFDKVWDLLCVHSLELYQLEETRYSKHCGVCIGWRTLRSLSTEAVIHPHWSKAWVFDPCLCRKHTTAAYVMQFLLAYATFGFSLSNVEVTPCFQMWMD